MSTFNIPGPGSAMALAAGVSIYSAAMADTSMTTWFLWMTVWFTIATLLIELIHKLKCSFLN